MAGRSGASGGKRGRPQKWKRSTAERIIKAVGHGLSYTEAARCGGISIDTLHRWRKQGREDAENGKRTALATFCQRVESAQDKTAEKYLEAIDRSVLEPVIVEKEHVRQNADGSRLVERHREVRPADIRGALWWLERRRPEAFGRREEIKHSGEVATSEEPRKVVIEFVNAPGRDESDDEAATEAPEDPPTS